MQRRFNTPELRDVLALDAAHVWHPYTQHHRMRAPLEITRARGAYLYDQSGRPILDAISSWWVTLHGHAQPEIASAIAEQAGKLEQVIFAGFTHEPAARLAAELSERLPGKPQRIFFSDDGSTAVEAALKMAMQYWRNVGEERTRFVALQHAYHGDTFGAMSASARGAFTAPFASGLFEVARLPFPEEGDTLAVLDRLLDDSGSRIAACIVEPLLLGAGGMRTWRAETLRSLVQRVRDAGALFIADEVLTGFGRTGPLFACELAGVEPDIVCLSKGITGGFMPLGATAAGEEIFAAFASSDRTRTFFHGHSYTANPIACSAALASLALLDERSAAKRRVIEAAHDRNLARLASHPRVERPRCVGTIGAFDIKTSAASGYFDSVGPQLADYALSRGVLLRPLGNVVYVLPPYCTTAEEITSIYAVIEAFLDEHE